jgi:hypothetical protein
VANTLAYYNVARFMAVKFYSTSPGGQNCNISFNALSCFDATESRHLW